jgi:hypothetical protein
VSRKWKSERRVDYFMAHVRVSVHWLLSLVHVSLSLSFGGSGGGGTSVCVGVGVPFRVISR